MAIQSQPSRIPEPFAGSGTKNTIPATNTTPSASQAASWASGFPPECSQPIGAGGCPVPRNDMNGALNQLSQDYAFRQDGGIWQWSALADYDAGRFLRGSDNSFYRAVAQNGPGTPAGAKDPTADDGTYWIKMPSMADIAAQNYATQTWVGSQGYATQTWVVGKLQPVPVYVDCNNGSDSNDGLTLATAVQTIAKALEITRSRTGQTCTVFLAAGVYTEKIDINIYNASGVIFKLLGNVTLSGISIVTANAIFTCQDNNDYTLSLNVPNGSHAIYVRQGVAIFECRVSVTGAAIDVVAYMEFNGSAWFTRSVVQQNGSRANTGIILQYSSSAIFLFNGETTIRANTCIFTKFNSSLSLLGVASVNLYATGYATNCIDCYKSSQIFFENCGINLNYGTSGNTSVGAIAHDVSEIHITGGTCGFHGDISTYNFAAWGSSFFAFDPNVTIPGDANTVGGTGRRFYVSGNSSITTKLGDLRIPGPNPGTVVSSTFAYYN